MMKNIPVALQLWSVRDDCARDFFRTLKSVANIGYQGVEFAGFYNTPAKELKKKLEDLGLKCAGSHTGLDLLLKDKFQSTVDYNLELGSKFLVIPGIPDNRRNTKTALLETCHLFNQVADQLKPFGLRLGYHNHRWEFESLEGAIPWDILCSTTRSEVIMQLDVGHALRAGSDPVHYLKKYPERATTVHIKEFSPTNDKALVGEGVMKWKDVLQACETVGGTEWYIVEQEVYPKPPMESCAECFANFAKIRH